MKATLGLEWIGQRDDLALKAMGGAMIRKPWVAEIMGLTKRNFQRRFVLPKISYAQSNSAMSRGAMLWFVVESGKFYEAQEYVSWRSKRRFYLTVSSAGEIVEIKKEDVERCLSEGLVYL